jgi:hypothetical protein
MDINVWHSDRAANIEISDLKNVRYITTFITISLGHLKSYRRRQRSQCGLRFKTIMRLSVLSS